MSLWKGEVIIIVIAAVLLVLGTYLAHQETPTPKPKPKPEPGLHTPLTDPIVRLP